MDVREITRLADIHNWSELDRQTNIGLISFTKEIDGKDARINVYTTKMTVSTCLAHPIKGKTQLFRKNVSRKMMEKIFQNPRVHTDRGYRTKTGRREFK